MTTRGQHNRSLDRLVVALFTSVGLAVLFAALTVLFRDQVIDYQLARGMAVEAAEKARQSLAITLWVRAGLVVAAAALYLWLARQLRRGSRRAYSRIRALSVIGLVALAYLLLSAQYPGWLRVVQVAQLAGLLGLGVAVTRPSVRVQFPKPPRRAGDRRAALVLVVLAPLVAEVALGSTPISMIWLVLLWLPIYSGTLFIRELARRRGAGWPGILLLGVAFGVVEEGIGVQALSSPTLYHAADWAPRVLGVNSAYAELNLPYHAVFSVAVPILLTELLFPASRTRPYLGRAGLVGCAVTFVLGVALLRLVIPPFADPGYTAPVPVLVGCVLAVVLLGVLVLGVAPRRRSRPPRPGTPPSPVRAGLAAGLASFAFLTLLFPFAGATQPAFTHGGWVLLPMSAALVLAAGSAPLLHLWSTTSGWQDGHLLALASGALVAHTAFGASAAAHTTLNRIGLVVLGGLMVGGLVLLARRVRARAASSPGVSDAQCRHDDEPIRIGGGRGTS